MGSLLYVSPCPGSACARPVPVPRHPHRQDISLPHTQLAWPLSVALLSLCICLGRLALHAAPINMLHFNAAWPAFHSNSFPWLPFLLLILWQRLMFLRTRTHFHSLVICGRSGFRLTHSCTHTHTHICAWESVRA